MEIFNWVLKDTLAIGQRPKNDIDLYFLLDKKIKSVLCLTNNKENPDLNYKKYNIKFKRAELPDHKSNYQISTNLIKVAYEKLINLIEEDPPLFIHCYASVERSPLICLAFLIKQKNLDFYDALAYLMQVHKPTNPHPDQLKCLKTFCEYKL